MNIKGLVTEKQENMHTLANNDRKIWQHFDRLNNCKSVAYLFSGVNLALWPSIGSIHYFGQTFKKKFSKIFDTPKIFYKLKKIR